MGIYIGMEGDAANGHTFHGPFDDMEDALGYMERVGIHSNGWVVAPLEFERRNQPGEMWANPLVQFARLICEIEAAGGFTNEIMQQLQIETDLNHPELQELFDRAMTIWEDSKSNV